MKSFKIGITFMQRDINQNLVLPLLKITDSKNKALIDWKLKFPFKPLIFYYLKALNTKEKRKNQKHCICTPTQTTNSNMTLKSKKQTKRQQNHTNKSKTKINTRRKNA